MKEYKTGDSICFKNTAGERKFGEVRFQLSRPEEGLYGYEVREEGEDGYIHTIHLSQIVDFEEISRKAGAALDRWHAEDRRKADLLSELLGRLGYYADHGGRIDYASEYSETRTMEPVSELVAEFTARRDAKPEIRA